MDCGCSHFRQQHSGREDENVRSEVDMMDRIGLDNVGTVSTVGLGKATAVTCSWMSGSV